MEGRCVICKLDACKWFELIPMGDTSGYEEQAGTEPNCTCPEFPSAEVGFVAPGYPGVSEECPYFTATKFKP